MKLKILLSVLFMLSFRLYAQKERECVDEILKLEEQYVVKDFNEVEKAVYINYAVKTTDWENQTIVSDVKVYKGKNNMHFFSEQASIFQDEKEVYMVLPMQKLVIVSLAKKELYNKGISNDFLELRKEFFDSCQVVRCESAAQNPSAKKVELKVKDDMNGTIKITRMIYEYNTQTGKIESTKIFYNQDYKVKEIVITYKEVNLQSDHKFGNARKYVLDRSGKLLSKYQGYELVDNRKD